MIEITGKSYIAGHWLAPGGEAFRSFNPYTGESMYGFTSCDKGEVEAAVDAADRAFQVYRNLGGEEIGLFLNTFDDEIESLGDQLL
mgnify:FL=1